MEHKQAPDIYGPYAVYDTPAYFEKMHPVEWRAQIQSSTEGRQFRIKYYGELYKWEVRQEEPYLSHFYKHHGKAFNGLITATDFAPELIYAVDIISNEEILLFDGCRHGYNNLFCDTYTTAQLQQRKAGHLFADATGNEVFEIVVHAFFNVDYEDEAENFMNKEGKATLITGEIVDLPYLKRNGFDAIAIRGYHKDGFISLHEAELA